MMLFFGISVQSRVEPRVLYFLTGRIQLDDFR